MPNPNPFSFGKNWQSYSRTALTKERMVRARKDFYRLMPESGLKGLCFLDIGFGQGLSLCLAAEAGAAAIGIDIDKDNVEAFEETCKWFGTFTRPIVKVGSILDPKIFQELKESGPFDVVQSWGVLHHTGSMWRAMENAAELTRKGGHLIISIYSKHWSSPAWAVIKLLFNKLPALGQRCMESIFAVPYYARIYTLEKRKPGTMGARGMEIRHDLRDWLGGYPYEYASIDEVIKFVQQQGMAIEKFFPCAGLTGCNEFVFRRDKAILGST